MTEPETGLWPLCDGQQHPRMYLCKLDYLPKETPATPIELANGTASVTLCI